MVDRQSRQKSSDVKKIGVVVKADSSVAKKADALENWLHSKGVETVRKENPPPLRMKITDQLNGSPLVRQLISIPPVSLRIERGRERGSRPD